MHTIYALLQPGTGEIRYVGRTKHVIHRMRVHYTHTQKLVKKSPLSEWLYQQDNVPECFILQEVEDHVACEAEDYWIKLLDQIPGIDLLNVLDAPSNELDAEVSRQRRLLGRLRDRLKLGDIEKIRESTSAPEDIARQYEISVSSVSRIKRGIITESVFEKVKDTVTGEKPPRKEYKRKSYPPANAKPEFLLGHKGRRIQNFLTPAQFEEIRNATGTLSHIGRQYNIDGKTVRRIKEGITKEDEEL